MSQQPPNYPNYDGWQQPQYQPWQQQPGAQYSNNQPPFQQQGWQQPNTYYQPQQQWQQPEQYQQQPWQQPPMMPQQPPPPKKKSKLPLILGIVAGVLLLSCIGGYVIISAAASHATNTLSNVATAIASVTIPVPTTAPTSKPQNTSGKWTTVQTFTGNGEKKTAIFSVPGDWKILYSCSGQNIAGTGVDSALIVTVYGSDNSVVDPAAVNATCKASVAKTTGETEEHQAGSVYLDINGTGDWTVTVQELK